MTNKLYVSNLNYDVTEDELSKLFSQCGQVMGARIIKDKETNRSKGFGFVEMANEIAAAQALRSMMGHDLRGRPMMVDEARDKPASNGKRR